MKRRLRTRLLVPVALLLILVGFVASRGNLGYTLLYLPLILVTPSVWFPHGTHPIHVPADATTEPVASLGDAADDPAIWVNPEAPERSLIIGTDKQAGLYVYDLAGRVLQYLDEAAYNNVDLRVSPWGRSGMTLIAATQKRPYAAIALLTLDHAERSVELTATVPVDIGEPAGMCLYMEGAQPHAIVIAKEGDIGQYEVAPDYTLTEVRRWAAADTESESCVVDDRTASLYFSHEDVGIWRIPLDLRDAGEKALFAKMEDDRLVPDVEGLAVVEGQDRRYLIASSQGNNSYAVYDIGSGEHLGSFHVVEGGPGVDGVTGTDGLDATATALPGYDRGLLVVQDGNLGGLFGRQSFKLVDWGEVLDAIGAG